MDGWVNSALNGKWTGCLQRGQGNPPAWLEVCPCDEAGFMAADTPFTVEGYSSILVLEMLCSIRLNRRDSPAGTSAWATLILICTCISKAVCGAWAALGCPRPSMAFMSRRGGVGTGGLPAGGLSTEDALAQVELIYESPLELRINDARLQVDPKAVGFSLKQQAMFTAVEDQIAAKSETIDVPLIAEVDESLIIKYLKEEISPRYNPISSQLSANPGLTTFEFTEGGSEIDIDEINTRVKIISFNPTDKMAEVLFTHIP